MKTIIEINTTNYASTGNIALNIAKQAREAGFNVYTCCKASKESSKYDYPNQLFIGNRYERILSSVLCTLTGLRDHFNLFGTYFFIRKIKSLKPDLIHLHVLHDDFINIRILFDYLSKIDIPVIWTLHDCNPLTGKCPYFDIVECEKWKSGCNHCPQLKNHPQSLFFDTTDYIWNLKKKLFNSVKNLTIVTPSKWLADNVKASFFKTYELKTIYNGINLNVFRLKNSDIKEKYNIKDKYLVLGVANVWNQTKGIDVFVSLSKLLPDNYQIMMVGTNDAVDSLLPQNIISIHRTYNQEELVDIYNAADVFVNPTREEVFGLVNVEAIACGTPVLVYNTGGCPEIIDDSCGKIIERNNIDEMKNAIIETCTKKPYSPEACINRAKQFDMADTFKHYIDLYKEKLSI